MREKNCLFCSATFYVGKRQREQKNRKYCSSLCCNRAKTRPPEIRFFEKVAFEPMSGCWLWFGDSNKLGYGNFKLKPNQTFKAHRASWILFKGDISASISVCHKCDTPQCVNPDHLFLGTHKDNIHDCINKGRFKGFDNLKLGRGKIRERSFI